MAATTAPAVPTTVKGLSADQKRMYDLAKSEDSTLTVKQAIAKAIEMLAAEQAAAKPAVKVRRKPAAKPAADADAAPAAKTRTRTPKVVETVETVEEVKPTPKRRPASRKPAAPVVETPAAETTPVVKKRPARKSAAETAAPEEVAPKPTIRRKPVPTAKPAADQPEPTPVTTYVLRSHKEYIIPMAAKDADVFTSTSLSDAMVFETQVAASRFATTHKVRELDNEATEIVAITRTGGRGRPSMNVVKTF